MTGHKPQPKKYCYDFPRPAVTVDGVVLSRRHGQTEVLLIRRRQPPFAGRWALPGGFVNIDEPLEAAVTRELREETGIQARKLTQIGAFGDLKRDPRGRTISIAYLISDYVANQAQPGDDAADVRWWPVDALPPLAFDHAQIIAAALKTAGTK